MALISSGEKTLLISFVGISISGFINIGNICWHHDRPFQLLSTSFLRLNIILPILSPFFFFMEYLVLPISGKFFLAVPIFPALLSALASAINIRLVAPRNRNRLIHPFKRRINSDSVMLLQSRQDGVPEIIGDSFTDRHVQLMIETHYNGMFWTSIAFLVIDVVCNLPWLFFTLGWTT
jgi:hypothetical protein